MVYASQVLYHISTTPRFYSVSVQQPTNHLDAESVAWMEDFLKSFGGTVVAITHDR